MSAAKHFHLGNLYGRQPGCPGQRLHRHHKLGRWHSQLRRCLLPEPGRRCLRDSGADIYVFPVGQTTLLTYTVTLTVTDVDGASAQASSTVVVGNIASGVAATMGTWKFVDQNSDATTNDFVVNGQTGEALINWGDGTSSLGTVSGYGNGSGPVTFTITPVGSHLYSQDSYEQPGGHYVITVTVTDDDGNILTGTQYVSVVRPTMGGNGDEVESSLNSLSLNNVQVAEFTVPDATDGTSEFSASINWGDGNSGSGTIQEVTPGLFEVVGSHSYAAGGFYSIQVDVSQGWNSSVLAIPIEAHRQWSATLRMK